MSNSQDVYPNPVSIGKYIGRFPAVKWATSGEDDDGYWWIKFHLDIAHPCAWHIVQALAYVFANLSINDPLPVFFYPTSSPPDMNGGPAEHLHWVLEPKSSEVAVSEIYSALQSSLLFDTQSTEEWLAWPAMK
jgi:hypothetical protein